jgi:hypothetical protein
LQTFVLSFRGTTAFSAPGLPLDFDCDGTSPAASIPGVNTVDLFLSSTPVPDIIALAATPTHDGIVHLTSGTGALAVATSNAGIAAPIEAVLDEGGVTLPIATAICQTDAATGQCLGAPADSVTIGNFPAGGSPTFSVFIAATGPIPFDPSQNRLFVRFRDSSGTERGATSVALETE